MPRSPDRSFFDVRELLVMDFAAYWHRTQVRKFTGEPYVNHLAAVAKTTKEYTKEPALVAVAFCHDLYEDTPCSETQLIGCLKEADFDQTEIRKINSLVWELTDKYIKSDYPDLNRRQRKMLEAERLWTISPDAQTVKYADLIDNSTDLAENDKDFGRVYLREMKQILENMDKGNPELYKKAIQIVEEVEKKLLET